MGDAEDDTSHLELTLSADAAEDGTSHLELTLSAEEAAFQADVSAMLRSPSLLPCPSSRTLEHVLCSCAPALQLTAAASGPGTERGVVSRVAISAGEVVLEETSTLYYLSRSPGTDTVASLEDAEGTILGTLPSWSTVRTFAASLTINQRGGGGISAAGEEQTASAPAAASAAEAAYALLLQLTVFGAPALHMAGLADSSQPPLLPAQPPGQPPPGDPLPRRAQLLHAIAQCNAYSAALPPDSNWLRGILWPLVGRLGAEDREALFEDAAPFSTVSAIFPSAACLNHSCEPNCQTKAVWVEGEEAPRAMVIARRDIAAGEELTSSYLPLLGQQAGSVAQRRRELLLSYRFACACGRCRREEPRAGTPQDPLARHFPHGKGLDASPLVRRGGALWSE